jgi:hypothetical protein
MGSVGKAIGNITKPVTKVVSEITPWNDDTEGIIPINHITPWNDNTTTGKLANAALLAAAAYGATQYFSGANAANTTTASQMATAPSADAAAAYAANTGTAGSVATGTSAFMPSADTALAYSPGELNLGTQATHYLGLTDTAAAGSGTGSTMSSLFGSGTTGASSNGVLSSLGSWAKENPMLATMAASGTIQGVGGYLSAKEQAEAQKAALEEQRRQFDAMHNYGGSFGGKGGLFKTPQAGIKQVNSVVDAREILQKIQYDPTYKKGFETMASKLINPDEANAILSAYKKYMGV